MQKPLPYIRLAYSPKWGLDSTLAIGKLRIALPPMLGIIATIALGLLAYAIGYAIFMPQVDNGDDILRGNIPDFEAFNFLWLWLLFWAGVAVVIIVVGVLLWGLREVFYIEREED